MVLNLYFEGKTFLKVVINENKDKRYEFMEYLGPEQITYSNICENINMFHYLSDEKEKKKKSIFYLIVLYFFQFWYLLFLISRNFQE